MVIPDGNSPKLSVVMAVYNGARYLRESLPSVLNQTFGDFEFIIVNDGSQDDSLEIINSFRDRRINIINQENQGLAKSLNNGLRQAHGEFIARMDADDICFLNRFEKQIKFLEQNPEYDLCGTGAILIDDAGNRIGERAHAADWRKIKRVILWKNQIIHSSVMFRRDFLDKYGYYHEEPRRKNTDYFPEDYELWLRAIWRGAKFAIIKEPLLYYRVNPDGLTYGKTRLSLLRNNLKIQWRAVTKYGFPKWQIIYSAKFLVSFGIIYLGSCFKWCKFRIFVFFRTFV